VSYGYHLRCCTAPGPRLCSAPPAAPQTRGLHSSTFQLNLSRFRHEIHPNQPVIHPDTTYTPP